MPTASKVLVRKGESALGSTSATIATMSSATVKAESAPKMLNKLFNPNGNGGARKVDQTAREKIHPSLNRQHLLLPPSIHE